MPLLPTLTVSDPDNARILFDLVNEEFSKGGQDRETRTRLADLMIALFNEMNPPTTVTEYNFGETSS